MPSLFFTKPEYTEHLETKKKILLNVGLVSQLINLDQGIATCKVVVLELPNATNPCIVFPFSPFCTANKFSALSFFGQSP